MRNVVIRLDSFLRRYTPDPFVIAILLTFVTFFSALIFTPSDVSKIVSSWGDSFWKLKEFTLQMAMILILGYAVAASRPITSLLERLCRPVHTQTQAIVLITIVSSITFTLNWGLGLVTTAFLCRKVAAKLQKVDYPLLVASGYGAFVVWHGGFSGSIPLLLATPDNFSQKAIGRIIPIQETLFSSYNIFLIVAVIVLLPPFCVLLSRLSGRRHTSIPPDITTDERNENVELRTPSDRMERSPLVAYGIIVLSLVYIVVAHQRKKLDLDSVTYIFFFLGLALHGSPRGFMRAVYLGAEKVGPILLQFPIYAGIMGILSGTGLAASISNAFANVATAGTYPLLTFLSAAFVNLFVPSGGGQWAVQGPIVVQAAQTLGADVGQAAMAVAWGGTWTDLIQPFWAVPLLSIAGLELRDVIGYLLVIFLALGVLFVGTFALI
jgi:short-chain fatty acids transporter